MYTWVCQRCGRDVDIAEVECPKCAAEAGKAKLGSAHGAPRGPVGEEPPTVSQERLPTSNRNVAPAPTVPHPAPPQQALAVRPLHLLLFALVLVGSLAAAVYLARPELFSMAGVSLPELPRAEVAPLQEGPIEVSGIRAWRDANAKLIVRAVLVNHTAGPHPQLRFKVSLRNPKTEDAAPAAATFEVELEEPLGARESREIETELAAAEGLTALPEWNRMSVRVEEIQPEP